MSIGELPAMATQPHADPEVGKLPPLQAGRRYRPQPRLRQRARARHLVFAVLLGGLLVRLVRLAMNAPLWGDEAMLVHSFLDRSYADLLKPLDYAQIAPLGFLWAEMTSYRWFGATEWVWRLVPTLAGCLSFVMFTQFARKILPRHAAWLAVGIMASSIYLIRHTVEAKPYILDFAFALGLAQIGWSIHEQPHRLGRWLAFGLFASLGAWCSFPSVFAAGGILLSLIPVLGISRAWPISNFKSQISDLFADQSGRRTMVLAWFACGLCLTASFVTMFLLFGRVQSETAHAAGYWQMSMWEVAYPPWQRPDLFLAWLIREHAGSMMAHPFGGKNFASIGTLVLVICGVITLYRRNPRLTGMLLAPAGVGLLAACLQKYPYGGTARTMLYLAPAICLFAGLGAWTLIARFFSGGTRRTAYSLALLGCLGLIGGRLIAEIAFPYKQYGDWQVRDAVRRWAAESEPQDVWIIANAAALPDPSIPGIFGGNTAAVFDHYALLSMGSQAWHSHEIIDCPHTAGQVVLLIEECPEKPATIEIGGVYQASFRTQAELVHEETLNLGGRETLRKLVFLPRRHAPNAVQ